MAQNWARRREDEMERGLYRSASAAEKTTLQQVIQRYATEITPRKACPWRIPIQAATQPVELAAVSLPAETVEY